MNPVTYSDEDAREEIKTNLWNLICISTSQLEVEIKLQPKDNIFKSHQSRCKIAFHLLNNLNVIGFIICQICHKLIIWISLNIKTSFSFPLMELQSWCSKYWLTIWLRKIYKSVFLGKWYFYFISSLWINLFSTKFYICSLL